MLDALKFAFEILVVGVLALPWLIVLSRIFSFGAAFGPRFDLSFVPEIARSTVAVAVVVAFGYLLGSAVSRFSRDFFNDELWKPLPTEDLIRDNVYYDEFCSPRHASAHEFVYRYWSSPIHLAPQPDFCPDKQTKAKLLKGETGKLANFTELTPNQLDSFDELVEEVFRLQESELLLQGVDKVDRLKQYYDQITVLRGAAFNGFILFLLCLFGSFGSLRTHSSRHRFIGALTFLPAGIVAIFALYSFWNHWHAANQSPYSDPPLAELIILLVPGAGLNVAYKADHLIPYFRLCILASIVTAVSFGGWWWTEVMYDIQVIHSLTELKQVTDESPSISRPPIGPTHPSTVSPTASTNPLAPPSASTQSSTNGAK